MKIGKLTDDDIEFLGMSIRNYNFSMSIYDCQFLISMPTRARRLMEPLYYSQLNLRISNMKDITLNLENI